MILRRFEAAVKSYGTVDFLFLFLFFVKIILFLYQYNLCPSLHTHTSDRVCLTCAIIFTPWFRSAYSVWSISKQHYMHESGSKYSCTWTYLPILLSSKLHYKIWTKTACVTRRRNAEHSLFMVEHYLVTLHTGSSALPSGRFACTRYSGLQEKEQDSLPRR